MKKKLSLLFTAALCATGAQAQSSVTLYGLLDTGLTYVNRVAKPDGTSGSRLYMQPGGMSPSRYGFRGVEDLGGGLKAVFILEGGIITNTGALGQGGVAFGRRSVVGMQTPYGEVLLGRQPDYLDDMGAMTSASIFGGQVAVLHGLDRTSTQRTNNAIRFNSATYAGVSVSAIWGLGENTGTYIAGSARGLAANYVNGGFRLATGYYESRVSSGTAANAADAGYAAIGALPGVPGVTSSPGDAALRTFTLASAYQWGPARLQAAYSQTEQPLAAAGGARSINSSANSRIQTLDVGMNYAVTPTLFVNASVIHSRMAFVAAPRGSVMQYNLGLDYVLSKRTDVYATVGQQSSSDMNTPGLEAAPGGGRSQTLSRVGVRHRF